MLPSLQQHHHLETANVHFNVDIQLGTHANIANMNLEHFGNKLLIYHSIILMLKLKITFQRMNGGKERLYCSIRHDIVFSVYVVDNSDGTQLNSDKEDSGLEAWTLNVVFHSI